MSTPVPTTFDREKQMAGLRRLTGEAGQPESAVEARIAEFHQRFGDQIRQAWEFLDKYYSHDLRLSENADFARENVKRSLGALTSEHFYLDNPPNFLVNMDRLIEGMNDVGNAGAYTGEKRDDVANALVVLTDLKTAWEKDNYLTDLSQAAKDQKKQQLEKNWGETLTAAKAATRSNSK